MSFSPPAPSPARRVRRWLVRLFILVVCIVVAGVVWN
ncbi:MAG TPA: peptidase, partial [Stenotrophomonas sp.]|nr:peptidase [Stenotrophomonas sp.]